MACILCMRLEDLLLYRIISESNTRLWFSDLEHTVVIEMAILILDSSNLVMLKGHTSSQAQLTSLPPLSVPQRLIHARRDEEGEGENANQTDQEKSVMKETANLMEVRLVEHTC